MSFRSHPAAAPCPTSPADLSSETATARSEPWSGRPFVALVFALATACGLAVPTSADHRSARPPAKPSAMPPAACAAAGRVDLETGDTTLRSPIAPTPLHCVRVRPGTGLLLAEAQTILDPMELRIAVFDAGCRAAPERLLDVSLSWALIETTEAPVHICVASRVPAAPLGPFALRLAATRLGGPGAPDLGTAGHKTEGDSTSDPIEPDPEGLGTALGLCTPGTGDDHADGVACATPVKTEGTVEGRLERLDDLDLFRFELPAEATVRAQAAGVYLHLLDAEGRPVGTPGETLATPLERVMPAGVWHLRVSARPSSATAGGDLHRPYRLLLALAEPAW